MDATKLKYKQFIAGALLVLIGLGIWFASDPKPPVMPFPGVTILPKPLKLSDFQLVDHHGKPFTKHHLDDKWSILFFGYTHCPDICPTTLAMLNNFYKEVDQQKTHIIFVTADPLRDTSARMTEHVTYYNKNFIGLTAPDIASIKAFGEEIGVIFDYEDPQTHELIPDVAKLPPGTKYNVEHNASIFIIDPKGRLVADMLPPHTADRLSKTFQLVKEYY